MILDGKDQNIEILMTQLELETDVNNVALHCKRETNAQWIPTKHAIENDLEPELQGFGILRVDQRVFWE
jgi:hypothetical protein